MGHLQAKATRTSDEEAQLKKLTATIQQGVDEIAEYFTNTVCTELERKPRPAAKCRFSRRGLTAELSAKHAGETRAARDGHSHSAGRESRLRDRGDGDYAKEIRIEGHAGRAAQQGFEVLETWPRATPIPSRGLAQLYAMVVAPVEGVKN